MLARSSTRAGSLIVGHSTTRRRLGSHAFTALSLYAAAIPFYRSVHHLDFYDTTKYDTREPFRGAIDRGFMERA